MPSIAPADDAPGWWLSGICEINRLTVRRQCRSDEAAGDVSVCTCTIMSPKSSASDLLIGRLGEEHDGPLARCAVQDSVKETTAVDCQPVRFVRKAIQFTGDPWPPRES